MTCSASLQALLQAVPAIAGLPCPHGHCRWELCCWAAFVASPAALPAGLTQGSAGRRGTGRFGDSTEKPGALRKVSLMWKYRIK